MRRAAALVLVLASVALPGQAQTPTPRLHREIPGDLGLADVPAGTVAPPASTDSIERSAAMTGWHEDQRPDDQVLHPTEAWTPSFHELDRQTRSPMGARLEYHEVFNPSVSPFKRQQAYDAVDDLGRLVVRDPSLRPVRVDAAPDWPREAPAARFTGDVFVQLAEGTPTSIPSVAGQQRVVSYRTEPAIPLAFLQDSAGNLFVRAGASRTVRLTYVLEAPEQAFVAPGIPGDPVTVRAPGTDAPTVPALVAQAAESVFHEIGIRRGEPYDRVLPRMVAYFREFRDADLATAATGNLYADLALGHVGACRHRAYAFVLTLHALGVPARYVHNEAHAWAEVAVPGVGWTRVDLGGWDINLHAEAPTPRSVFVPTNADPYPRPAQYSNGYSTLSNLHPGQRSANAAPPPDPGQGQGQGSGTEPGNSPGGGSPGGTPPEGEENPADADGTHPPTESAEGTPGGTGQGGGQGGSQPGSHGTLAASGNGSARGATAGAPLEGTDPASPESELPRTALTLDPVTSDDPTVPAGAAYIRGSLLRCAGEARDEAGMPVADLPVEVLLSLAGRPPRSLGTTVTGADGRFSSRVLLPFDLPVGDYALRVRTTGDTRHAAAESD